MHGLAPPQPVTGRAAYPCALLVRRSLHVDHRLVRQASGVLRDRDAAAGGSQGRAVHPGAAGTGGPGSAQIAGAQGQSRARLPPRQPCRRDSTATATNTSTTDTGPAGPAGPVTLAHRAQSHICRGPLYVLSLKPERRLALGVVVVVVFVRSSFPRASSSRQPSTARECGENARHQFSPSEQLGLKYRMPSCDAARKIAKVVLKFVGMLFLSELRILLD